MARYVAPRRHDLRDLQRRLVPFGLSSLGRLEGHVLESLDAVARSLALIAGREYESPVPQFPSPDDVWAGERILAERAATLLGHPPAGSDVCIMVTIDPAAVESPAAIGRLIQQGATVFRINCAHDSRSEWERVALAIRQAERTTGQRCHILVDLAGPKIRIAEVFAAEGERLHPGAELLLIERDPLPRHDWPRQFRTTVPDVVRHLKAGDHVRLDDGRLDSTVERVLPGAAVLRVVHTRKKGERLRSDKGLNLPGVQLPLQPLTPKDLSDLDFAVASADMVGLSFVRQASDVAALQQELRSRRAESPPAVIAKIESLEAFRSLPAILAQGLQGNFGVMIARGDLAVEVGFERLAEVQEEILWLCESAHVPVIWATQVLEALSKDGVYSRPELTDAAMGIRAECVMLNKGEHLAEAVASLRNVLTRMAGHHRKKSAQLRALSAW